MALTISSFHDSSIETITYNWNQKLVTVTGHLCSPSEIIFNLNFIDCSMVVIPHTNQWGPSKFILEIEKNSDFEYTIQMQSGDLISITCHELQIHSEEIT